MRRALTAFAAALFLLGLCGAAEAKIQLGGPVAPDGKTEVAVDLPADQRRHNIGSPSPRFEGDPRSLGCCVFSSIDHAGRWQNVLAVYQMPEWMVKSGIQGGGWDRKVDELIPKIAKDRGLPTPDYLQYTGTDPAILEAALKTGRMPCVTYNGHDGVHYRQGIAHMVNLVYLDSQQACILDNNFIGEDELVWMGRQEFLDRWTGGGGGWCVILLAPRPPPVPHN